MGFLILNFAFTGNDENIMDPDRLALANATYIWLSGIPIYGIGGIFFYLFYKYEHVWKSRGVVVGYEYDHVEHAEYERECENGEMTDLSKALVHNLLESDYLIRMG